MKCGRGIRSMMSRTAFMKALSTRLYPILRAEGFRGSGNTLRRINDPTVHVFNVQAESSGTSCFLNLGAHLLFLPKPGGGQPDSGTLKEYECAFRERFDPPPGPGFGWSYGRTEIELSKNVAFICDHWAVYGHDFFSRYSNYPIDFESLVSNVDVSVVHPIELLTLARIAAHLGDSARSASLAQEALKRCSERATGLRSELIQIVRNVTKT